MSKGGNRRGRWTQREREYIDRHIHSKPLEEIALELKRPLEALVKYKNNTYGQITSRDIKEGLRVTPEWAQLTKEFFDAELDMFEHRYGEVMSQFADDIMPTERMQVFQMVKYEILMSRNMQERKRSIELMDRVRKQLVEARRAGTTDADRIRVEYLEQEVRNIDISNGAKSKEYLEFQKQHGAILKDLKATREQRIKNVEARRKSWIDIIKDLETKDFKEKEGAELALMKKAIEKESRRLAEYHQYSPDLVDRPILSAETIGEDES